MPAQSAPACTLSTAAQPQRGTPVAAEALEQSVLEAKDKDQLLAIAKALGLKATTRTKKADIIDSILETTGVSTARSAAPADVNATAGASGDEALAAQYGDDAEPATGRRYGADTSAPPRAARTTGQRPDSGRVASSSPRPVAPPLAPGSSAQRPVDEPVLGEDGEPLAEWELELRAMGDVANATEVVASPNRPAGRPGGATNGRPPTSGSPGSRPGPNGPASSSRAQPNRQSDGQQPGGQQPGGRQSGREQPGSQGSAPVQSGAQPDGQLDAAGPANGQGAPAGAGQVGQDGGALGEGDGESRNRRRRRRRKGNRATDEAQGDESMSSNDANGDPGSGAQSAAEAQAPVTGDDESVAVSGYLDMRDEGYGFLRVKGYLPSRDDSYIPVKLARQYGLRKGDHITGLGRPAARNEKNPALLEVLTVNGGDPEAAKRRPRFEDLTALFPDSNLRLEDPQDPTNMTARIIDLVAPIGKGQRGIIVSPPKAGKTTIMKTIARAIEQNNPEVKLIVLLVDERPEEVTDIRRTVQGEVIASTFDRPSEEHTHVAELTIEKAKRLVEMGEDVVIILDGITRLSRAYNLAAPASGRILSGGIDAGALYPPKKFFGAARNVEEGGSLTILATALVDTNSRMDEAIFEEFKGTGNMELRLDRRLSERRIYPAIDVDASSTRHEELLFDRQQLQTVWKLRRVLTGLAADGNAAPGLELLIDRLKSFRTNAEFLSEIAKQPHM